MKLEYKLYKIRHKESGSYVGSSIRNVWRSYPSQVLLFNPEYNTPAYEIVVFRYQLLEEYIIEIKPLSCEGK